jgi:hypothetical protein
LVWEMAAVRDVNAFVMDLSSAARQRGLGIGLGGSALASGRTASWCRSTIRICGTDLAWPSMVPVHWGVRRGRVGAHSPARALSTEVDRQRARRAHPPADLVLYVSRSWAQVRSSGGVGRRSFRGATRSRGGRGKHILHGGLFGGSNQGSLLLLEALNCAS